MQSPSETLAHTILQTLQRHGHTAYLAGGCVRDRLMGREPKDFDVATSALPDAVLTLFPRSQQVGAAFGVILVRGKDKAQVEVATFRADGSYSDGRRPDSVRFTDAREDAQRRDFTCNGIFFDPLANNGVGELHDFVGGRADIEAKVLRAIGNPAARFGEDHLRMLRAIRFAGKLDFRVEPATFIAIKAGAENIRTVSKERIHDEVSKILTHGSRGVGAALLLSTGLLRQLWPAELFDPTHHFSRLSALPAHAPFAPALAAMCMDLTVGSTLNGRRTAELLREAFLLSNEETDDVAWLIDSSQVLTGWRQMSKAAMKRLMADARWDSLAMLMKSALLPAGDRNDFAAKEQQMRDETVAPAPFITGDTLIGMGATPGRKFKQWLDELYDRQLEGELTTADQARDAARLLISSA